MATSKDLFFRHLGLPSATPLGLEIKEAHGIYLHGADGKKYIDLVSGVSVSNLGHNHPAIVSAAKDQIDKHMHLMVYGEMVQSPQVLLAEKLAELLPGNLPVTYFVSTGSEAVEGALKLAKRYTGRTEIAAFRSAYHGGTHGALSILGHEPLKNAFRPLLPDVLSLRFNETGDLPLITERTACVVVESIQAEAGIILPDKGYLRKLRDRCNQTGALLITDDIQMGMGRTGKMFSFEHYDYEPDILCLAKALGAGMPLGAFISSAEIMKTFTCEPELGHITTFGGHPVSCAAALAGIRIIEEEKLSDNATLQGQLICRELKHHPKVKSIRQKGLMLAVELHSEEKVTEIMHLLLHERLIVDRFLFNKTSFRIAPPLTINTGESTEVVNRVIRCLDAL